MLSDKSDELKDEEASRETLQDVFTMLWEKLEILNTNYTKPTFGRLILGAMPQQHTAVAWQDSLF